MTKHNELPLTAVKTPAKKVPNKSSSLNPSPLAWCFHQFQSYLQNAQGMNLSNQIFYVFLTLCRTCFPSLQTGTAKNILSYKYQPFK